MTRNPTPEQSRRRRRAAFVLRQRAHDLLDDASRLDGLPAMRILMTDLKRIAEVAGCDPEKLADAALALYPGTDNDPEGGVMNEMNRNMPKDVREAIQTGFTVRQALWAIIDVRGRLAWKLRDIGGHSSARGTAWRASSSRPSHYAFQDGRMAGRHQMLREMQERRTTA